MNARCIRHFTAALGLLALSAAVPSWAADYYVDQAHPQASDSNPGSEGQPWLTLYRAAKAALQPGDTVYVKKGTYDVSTGGTWSSPAINIPSGAAGKPVTFKSLPRHAAILDTKNTQGNPAIGVNGRNHVVIDGFVIPKPGNKGIAIFNANDVVVQNTIIHGVFVGGFDNTEGIRVENAQNVVVRNNKIHDVHNSENSSNASGVKSYKVRNLLIENNEIYDVVAAVKEKEASSQITVRNNRFYDCKYGFVLNNQNGGVTEAIRLHNNVIECNSGFESTTQGSAIMRDVHIYNNTFIDYRSKGVGTNEHGEQFFIHNNIFYRALAEISMADFFTRQPHTQQVKLMDYNLYSRDPKIVVGLYSLNDTTNSLAAWQSKPYRLDQNSLRADPRFVDAASGNYRLAAGSPALNAGRDDHGAAVNIGAYATGREIIGLLPERGLAPPAPPRLVMP